VEQGVALIVDVEQESGGVREERREGRETVIRDGKEGSVAVGERLDERVSAVPEECADHLSVILEHGPVKGCEVLVVDDVETGVFFEELLDDILVSRTYRKVQRCLSIHVLGIGVSAMLQQRLDNVLETFHAGQVERCVAS